MATGNEIKCNVVECNEAEAKETEGNVAEDNEADSNKSEGIETECKETEGNVEEDKEAESNKTEGIVAEVNKAEGNEAGSDKPEGIVAERSEAEGKEAESNKTEGIVPEVNVAESKEAESNITEGNETEDSESEGDEIEDDQREDYEIEGNPTEGLILELKNGHLIQFDLLVPLFDYPLPFNLHKAYIFNCREDTAWDLNVTFLKESVDEGIAVEAHMERYDDLDILVRVKFRMRVVLQNYYIRLRPISFSKRRLAHDVPAFKKFHEVIPCNILKEIGTLPIKLLIDIIVIGCHDNEEEP